MHTDDPIALSALQHYVYCPRQWALIHVEQVFDQNIHTMRGNAVHQKVDVPGFEERTNLRVERALPVWSDRHGLIGKCDVVEFLPDGTPYPVEYKHGKKRAKLHDEVQLAAQAMCLEEMTGKSVIKGAIYHHSSRSRREVAITPALRQTVTDTSAAIRTIQASGILPEPVNDGRCKECSLIDSCQPEALTNRSAQMRQTEQLFDPEK